MDFDTLAVLGERAASTWRRRCGAAWRQHLPDDFFNKFPEVETLEIHLATGFMNLFLDNADFPANLTEKLQ